MILNPGEKVHVIHRRYFEKEAQRHFIGEVEAYDAGVARVRGYMFVVDDVNYTYVKRPDIRTRILAISSGDLLINVIPSHIDLHKVIYHQEGKATRITDGSAWHLDIGEFTWK